MSDERSVRKALSHGFIHYLHDAAWDTEPQPPQAEAEENIHALGCGGAGCLHGESGTPMKLPGQQLRRGFSERRWSVPQDPVSPDVVVAVGQSARRCADVRIVPLGSPQPVEGLRCLHVVEAIPLCAGRVATHYHKLAANDLAFTQLASIRLWLRVN